MHRITSTNGIELSDEEQEHLFALIHKDAHSARVGALPEWDLATQAAPDYEVDQRINW